MNDYNVNSLSVLHFRDFDNSLLFFDHYSVLVPQTIECKYPDIIEHSFDHDWIFNEVTESEIREDSFH